MKDDFADEPPKKKNKKEVKSVSKASEVTNGRTKFRSVDQGADEEYFKVEEGEDPQDKYGSMEAEFHDEDDWTPLIQDILTVDYSMDDPNLVIYFLRL
jgi:hypothetical protein